MATHLGKDAHPFSVQASKIITLSVVLITQNVKIQVRITSYEHNPLLVSMKMEKYLHIQLQEGDCLIDSPY